MGKQIRVFNLWQLKDRNPPWDNGEAVYRDFYFNNATKKY